MVRFGSVLAPFLAPKLAPNRPKIGPRRLLRPFFLKNADFYADLRFPRKNHQNGPQDEAEIGPRSPQDGTKTVLKSFFFDVKICLRFWSVLGSVLVAFGAPFGSQVGAKVGQKIDQKTTCAPRPPQDRPRAPQERPKSAQEASKRRPRARKRHPKAPKRCPRAPRRHPRERR